MTAVLSMMVEGLALTLYTDATDTWERNLAAKNPHAKQKKYLCIPVRLNKMVHLAIAWVKPGHPSDREPVIPAQAGIQLNRKFPRSGATSRYCPLRGMFFLLDSGLRRNDGADGLLSASRNVFLTGFRPAPE